MAPFCLALTKGCATVNPRISLWLLLILSVWLTACSKTEHQDLSEKPPLSIVPHQTMVNESVIRTRLRIPIDSLQQKLEQDIPEMLYNSPGKVKQKCIRIFGKNHCEEFQVGGWAKRTGPVQLLALNNGYLRVQLPLQYQLSATANGRLIRGLLKEVDFKPASFTAIADLNPSIDSNWHLQVTSRSQIVWRRSPVVKVLGVKIDIQDQIEKPLKKALDKALAKQQLKLASDDRLATRMKDFWFKLQQPRLLTDKFPLWLKATPSALSLSNIQIENNAIQLGLSLKTTLQTASSESALASNITPLPALKNQAFGASVVSINLPLTLDYQELASELQQRLKNKPILLKQGNASVEVKGIEIYPSNDRLVLASKVTLNGFKNWFTSEGAIFISGKPVIDNQTHVIHLADVEFSRKLDSPFWTAATSLMQTQLLESLQKSLVHDFSDDYTKLHSSLNAQLQNHQKGNLTLNGRFDRLDVKDVYLDLDELRIVLEAAGAVDMELEP